MKVSTYVGSIIKSDEQLTCCYRLEFVIYDTTTQKPQKGNFGIRLKIFGLKMNFKDIMDIEKAMDFKVMDND